jgi:ribosomal protein S13
MSISELLMSQRSWGRTRSRRLLVSAGIPETKRLGNLTERQRKATAALLALRHRAK